MNNSSLPTGLGSHWDDMRCVPSFLFCFWRTFDISRIGTNSFEIFDKILWSPPLHDVHAGWIGGHPCWWPLGLLHGLSGGFCWTKNKNNLDSRLKITKYEKIRVNLVIFYLVILLQFDKFLPKKFQNLTCLDDGVGGILYITSQVKYVYPRIPDQRFRTQAISTSVLVDFFGGIR